MKAIIFDLDDTLYSFAQANKKALKATHKVYGKGSFLEFYTTISKIRETIAIEQPNMVSSHDRVVFFARFLEQKNEFTPAKTLQLYKAYWNAFYKNMVLYPHTLAVLEYCKKKYKIGLLTDFTPEIQYNKLKTLKITKYFDVIVTSGEVGYDKPHKKMFQTMIKKIGCKPNDCLMIGDNLVRDVGGATKAKMNAVWVKHHNENLAHLEKIHKHGIKPNYTIKDIKELLEIV